MTVLSLVKSSSKSVSLKPWGMFARRLQFHQVDDVHDTDFQLGQMLAQDGYGRQCFQRGHITVAGHHHIGRDRQIVAEPLPDAFGAVFDGRIHAQPLRRH